MGCIHLFLPAMDVFCTQSLDSHRWHLPLPIGPPVVPLHHGHAVSLQKRRPEFPVNPVLIARIADRCESVCRDCDPDGATEFDMAMGNASVRGRCGTDGRPFMASSGATKKYQVRGPVAKQRFHRQCVGAKPAAHIFFRQEHFPEHTCTFTVTRATGERAASRGGSCPAKTQR